MLPQIGEEGQRRLLGSSALIVGLGGLGCPVGLYLAAGGVGSLGLCDADRVSASNLQRQTLYGDASVGKPKVSEAARRLRELSATTHLDLLDVKLTESNADEIISRYDIVMDCCDNFATRYIIDDSCRRLAKPWVYASAQGLGGQLSVFMPESDTRYPDLFPEREELAGREPASGGILGPVAGAIGALAATEALKILAGCRHTLVGKLLTIDLENYQFNTFDL